MSLFANPVFRRRLGLYLIGLVMGSILVSVITKGKACQLPSTVKMDELKSQPVEYTEHARCRMECRHITENDVKTILTNGSINYSKSEVHDKPCGTYAVEGKTQSGVLSRVIVADCDSISKIVTVIDLDQSHDCNCK